MNDALPRKSILVTGASGGLGSSFIEPLLREPYRALLCHSFNRGERIEKFKRSSDSSMHLEFVQGDLSVESDVLKLKDLVEKNFKDLWGIVHLSGVTTSSLVCDMDLADFQSVINSNLVSAFLVCKHLLPILKKNGGGRILFAGSVVAELGCYGAAHYSAAKAALNGLARSIALESAQDKVTCNVLGMGYFDAGLIHSIPTALQEKIKQKIPFKRFGQPHELFSLVKYLLSEDSEYMTGQVLGINGGLNFS